jgi:hypothetical protein
MLGRHHHRFHEDLLATGSANAGASVSRIRDGATPFPDQGNEIITIAAAFEFVPGRPDGQRFLRVQPMHPDPPANQMQTQRSARTPRAARPRTSRARRCFLL